eukprot:CAMPEP_0115015614 /NCGR_PEP_ID=MMETSP0216-20121206/26883_1 /TAXON_ID=223996 /ORGANISM="Protocruzia adherens, Strain Boccale" /LENGTH=135 /DNA_ID=CAMNT_0002385787 /DNA_START=67 /DNA_END=474 /DNA_ORIENTATION=-
MAMRYAGNNMRAFNKYDVKTLASPMPIRLPHRSNGENLAISNKPGEVDLMYEILDSDEIQVRIVNVLKNFEKINLRTFKWDDEFENDLKFDSLEQTVLLTSLEEEFHIVFEDRVFEHFSTLDDVIHYISSDPQAF